MEVGRWRQPNGRSGSASGPQTVIGKASESDRCPRNKFPQPRFAGDNLGMTDDFGETGQMRNALLPGRSGLFVRLASNPAVAPGYSTRSIVTPTDCRANNTEAFVIALDPDDEDVVWLYEWFTDEAGLKLID